MSVAPATCVAGAPDKFSAKWRFTMATSITTASDAELIDIATQTFNVMNGNLAGYPGVTQAQVDDLKSFKDTFNVDLTAHIAAQAAAKSKTQTKDASRKIVEDQLRTLRNIAKSAGASEADMAALGIPAASQKAPPNATRPAVRVDTSQRLQHKIHWTEESTPDNKRKPIGAMGAEIWAKYDGPPPIDESECTFLTLDAFSPYLKDYSGADAGKMAHYLVRWRMRDGSTSAWGETVSATITG